MRTFIALGSALLLVGTASAQISFTSLVGDEDNFGFGPGGTIPNVLFNNAGPDDIGIFDFALNDSGTTERIWQHDFSADLAALGNPALLSVTVEVLEVFSDVEGVDPDDLATISLDGVEQVFNQSGIDSATTPTFRSFTFTGLDAQFAADGIIDLQLFENGDNIALDFSRVTVTVVPSPSTAGVLLLTSVVGLRRRR